MRPVENSTKAPAPIVKKWTSLGPSNPVSCTCSIECRWPRKIIIIQILKILKAIWKFYQQPWMYALTFPAFIIGKSLLYLFRIFRFKNLKFLLNYFADFFSDIIFYFINVKNIWKILAKLHRNDLLHPLFDNDQLRKHNRNHSKP